MDLVHGGRCERPACVRAAPLIAFVCTSGPVFDVASAPAVGAAGTQLRIERVEDLAIQATYGQASKQWANVVGDVALVGDAGRVLELDH